MDTGRFEPVYCLIPLIQRLFFFRYLANGEIELNKSLIALTLAKSSLRIYLISIRKRLKVNWSIIATNITFKNAQVFQRP
jgi:uncharacterized integral membrane protein